MPSSAKTAHTAPAAPSTIYVGLDVHKDSVTLAVLAADAPAPIRVDKLRNDPATLRRYLDRLATPGTLRLCYEASGAGYLLYRLLRDWGYACEVIARTQPDCQHSRTSGGGKVNPR